MAKVYTQRIIEMMWARGMPSSDARWANIFRAAVAAGLTNGQATALTAEAYHAANGFDFNLPAGSPLHYHTLSKNAAEHPNGKAAEVLAAINEGRPSRWGTAEFHAPHAEASNG